MEDRLTKLRRKLAEENLDGFLSLKIQNVYYLSGFTGDTGAVFVTKDDAYFFADSRFELQASQQAVDFQVVPVERSYINSIADFISKGSWNKIGIEANHLTIGGFQRLEQGLAEWIELSTQEQLIEKLRMVKDPSELEIMKRALELTEQAFADLRSLIKPGVSERYLQVELLKRIYDIQGFSGPSFDFIIASGERGALPHGVATDKKLKQGEFITFDFGGVYERYCSDITRTIALGQVDAELEQIYQVVREAQLAAEKAAKPGMTGIELDGVARQIIENAGYGEYFGHGLGHGVGLEIHELPTASPKGDYILQPGMIITIEPGIYLPNKGGVRIENEIVITEIGAEVWNRSDTELVVL